MQVLSQVEQAPWGKQGSEPHREQLTTQELFFPFKIHRTLLLMRSTSPPITYRCENTIGIISLQQFETFFAAISSPLLLWGPFQAFSRLRVNNNQAVCRSGSLRSRPSVIPSTLPWEPKSEHMFSLAVRHPSRPVCEEHVTRLTREPQLHGRVAMKSQ